MAELARTNLFATPVWIQRLEGSAKQNDALHEAIRAIQKDDPAGRSVSNEGGWQSRDDLHRRPEFREFVEEVSAAIQTIARSVGSGASFAVESCWANVNPPYSHNTTHVHALSLFSGAYYVRAPADCGRIRFQDPRPGATMLDYSVEVENEFSADRVVLPVVEGALVVFPAYLPHGVEANRATADRVSLSFNVGYARS